MPSGEEFPLPIPPRRIQASGTKGDFQGGFPLENVFFAILCRFTKNGPYFSFKKEK